MIQRHFTMKNAKRAWYTFAIAVPTLAVGMVAGLFLMFLPYINYWMGWAIGSGAFLLFVLKYGSWLERKKNERERRDSGFRLLSAYGLSSRRHTIR